VPIHFWNLDLDWPPTSLRRCSGHAFLPRDAGENEGRGLNGLNDWNVLNVLNESAVAIPSATDRPYKFSRN
jgi:hypothetical protein